jgi:hypothetical protein
MNWQKLSQVLVISALGCSEYGVEEIDFPDPLDTGEAKDFPSFCYETPVYPENLVCPDRVWGAGEVGTDESCFTEPVMGTFNPEIEWSMFSFDEFPDYHRAAMTPVVGHMTDDNGDGLRNELDVPDLLLLTYNSTNWPLFHGVMRLISGDGTVVHWSVQTFDYKERTYWPWGIAGGAFGDIDSDGVPDIVTTVWDEESELCFVAAFEPDGQIKWVATDETVKCASNQPALADLQGDGSPDVVVGNLIIDGTTGFVSGVGEWGAGLDSSYGNSGAHAFPIDLDGDGVQEIVTGRAFYNADGTLRCLTSVSDGYPAVADLNGDGYGEVVITGREGIRIVDRDCWLLDSWDLAGSGRGGPATIADFDGDGQPEIGVAEAQTYTCYEVDGTVLWSQKVVDISSNSTGSSVYDFEGDGYAEVVYADETTLWVFSGSYGYARLTDRTHSSGTVNEYPVIADVDGDGEVEIVLSDYYGVYVVGDADHSWVNARQVWNQQSYNITNINDDLSIPKSPLSNWPKYNSFRSGDLTTSQGANQYDLFPVWVDVCFEDCDDGIVQIVVQVANSGLAFVPMGQVLQLIWESDTGERTLLAEDYTTFDIQPGRTSHGMVFRLERTLVEGDGQLIVYVPPLENQPDCHPENNEWVVDKSVLCPE